MQNKSRIIFIFEHESGYFCIFCNRFGAAASLLHPTQCVLHSSFLMSLLRLADPSSFLIVQDHRGLRFDDGTATEELGGGSLVDLPILTDDGVHGLWE